MKFTAIAIAAIVAMSNVVAGTTAAVEMAATDSAIAVLPPSNALELAQSASTPKDVEFTGSVDKIEQPAGAKETLEALATTNDDADTGKQEGFGWGGGFGAGYGWGLGGWGNWGGWGGFGPYRFGFRCGGVPGWAYPLGYWNLFGAGLYGGDCGLGVPFGGLYYC
ncbi:hypothetical protein PHYPSEUDO_006419 [Phytophthora pseudosyringae]|uniref:Uncharacterized protein n=1 Tax=Phytophthora pseudosyringae TaxID=221518 RepID=A0A8T1VLR4_9STRA|nr:hypothetical protein PHYPSEUDO_006419 [Phytophthora pseudosyringae]